MIFGRVGLKKFILILIIGIGTQFVTPFLVSSSFASNIHTQYSLFIFFSPGNKDYNLYAAHYDDRLSNQYEDVDFDTKHYSAYERLTQKLYDSIYNKPYTGVEKLDEFDDSASVPHGKDQYGGDFDGLENVQYRHPSSDDVTTESPALADNQYEVFVNSNRTLDEDNLQTNYRHVGGGKKKKDAAKKKVYRGHWFIGDWGECSATCGQGTISREFACVNHENTAVLPDSDCPPKRPKAYKICELKECKDVMTWNVGEWSQVYICILIGWCKTH